jgi:predicted NAD/FAD-dependent oxidoreductase
MLLTESPNQRDGLYQHFNQTRIKLLDNDQYLILYEMKEEYGQEFFEQDQEEIKAFFLKKMSITPIDCHVHKWRYSEVVTSIPPEYQTSLKDKNIYFAGDFFGSSGVESSLKSADSILHFLS